MGCSFLGQLIRQTRPCSNHSSNLQGNKMRGRTRGACIDIGHNVTTAWVGGFLPTISVTTVCIALSLPGSHRRTGLCHGNKYEIWLLTYSDTFKLTIAPMAEQLSTRGQTAMTDSIGRQIDTWGWLTPGQHSLRPHSSSSVAIKASSVSPSEMIGYQMKWPPSCLQVNTICKSCILSYLKWFGIALSIVYSSPVLEPSDSLWKYSLLCVNQQNKANITYT